MIAVRSLPTGEPAFLPAMVERGRGELVIYSSLDGWVPARKMSAYAASKAAVNAYAEVLAAEYRGSGVKIRCVCPGVDTPQYRSLAAEDPAAVADHRSIMPASVVVDAVERSLAGDGLFVFPGAVAKAAITLRRHFPRLLGRLVDYDTSPARSIPRPSPSGPTGQA